MPAASRSTTAGSPGVRAYSPNETTETTNRTETAPTRRWAIYPNIGSLPAFRLGRHGDLIVDDVQVAGVQRVALDLLAGGRDEWHHQQVDVGHVGFDDLLGLLGQGFTFGRIGLAAQLLQHRLQLRVGIAAVISRAALHQRLVEDVQRIT